MPSGRRRFVFIGRHERRKGVPELIRAIASLEPGMAEFHFIGPIPASLRFIRPDVFYHGPIHDSEVIKQRLDACDVLICPSFAEGMPTVVLEAMARGLAIIATDVGATASWVDHGNGILLKKPSVASVRLAILTLAGLGDDDLFTLQRASAAKAQGYTWQNVAGLTIDAIEGLLTHRVPVQER